MGGYARRRSGLIPARAGNTRGSGDVFLLEWAHPRSRGEHREPSVFLNNMRGSSPLARGTPRSSDPLYGSLGLIPARAGNTPSKSIISCHSWAHPRSRGEHHARRFGGRPGAGSSPLARGTRPSLTTATCRCGLIPARAWNTVVFIAAEDQDGAHPRSRGEHKSSVTCGLRSPGSSPLARGTHYIAVHFPYVAGLIPARAGNTPGFRKRPSTWRAHPRSRGEHVEVEEIVKFNEGSSPLARETHPGLAAHPARGGLIPARAGNTRRPLEIILNIGAHPRSRGEHDYAPVDASLGLGSSPPVRGARDSVLDGVYKIGLIPARAGSTGVVPLVRVSSRAHPRPCGEHSSWGSPRCRWWGSSPPARGAPPAWSAPQNSRGLIPARAGSTRPSGRRSSPLRAHPRPCGEHVSLVLASASDRGSSPPVRGALAHQIGSLRLGGLIPARAGSTLGRW